MDMNIESMLEGYFPEGSAINEETKNATLKETISTILKSISEKIASLDVDFINKTSGDVKRLHGVEGVYDSVYQLETLVDRALSKINPEIVDAVQQISTTFFYLNQYSAQFKDAYRNKKTAIILKYQSLVLSIISGTSYLISVLVDFSNGDIELKNNIKFEYIAPLKALKEFNQSAKSGEFRTMLRDVQVIRESFNENFPDGKVVQGDTINEGVMDVANTIINGLKNFYNNLDRGGKMTGILYRTAGFVATIFSVREALYTLSNMRSKARDLMDMLSVFGNPSGLSGTMFNKISNFANKFKLEAEYANDMAKRDISSEDRNIIRDVNPNSIITVKPDEDNTPLSKDMISAFDF